MSNCWGSSATVSLMDFFDMSSPFYDSNLHPDDLGNNTANRFAQIATHKLGIDPFSRVTIRMGGSGGVDNLAFSTVPEPTTAALMTLGLLVAGSGRRRPAKR